MGNRNRAFVPRHSASQAMSPKILLVLSLLCVTVYTAPPRRTAARCLSNHEFEYTPDRGGRADTDQMLGCGKEHAYQAHMLCESAKLPDGRVVRTKTEMIKGKIGFGTGWQSSNA